MTKLNRECWERIKAVIPLVDILAKKRNDPFDYEDVLAYNRALNHHWWTLEYQKSLMIRNLNYTGSKKSTFSRNFNEISKMQLYIDELLEESNEVSP